MTRSPRQTRPPADRPRSLLDQVSSTSESAVQVATSGRTWAKILIVAAAFSALTYWQYERLVEAWLFDSNWTHGFIIPLFSIFLIYQRRDEIFSQPPRPFWPGLAVMVLGILWMFVATYPIGNQWLSQCAMPVILFGTVLLLLGWKLAVLLSLPIFYLLLAFPIPMVLYERIAYPLQELAAQSSVGLLQLIFPETGLAVRGSEIAGKSLSGEPVQLTVAEACSGVRSLMAFVALGVAMAYITDRPLWQRVVLVLSILPVTTLCNIMRVTGTCAFYVVDKPELGQGFMHHFMGMLMLIPALVLFLLLAKLLDAIFVEEDEQPEPAAAGATGDKPDRRSLSDELSGGAR